jgi:branched-chain amino acid transport system permease protein
MVIMVVTGGKGTLAGPVVGGIIFGLMPEILRSMQTPPELQWVIYGGLMIAVVYFLPGGIVPAVAGLWKRQREARAGGRQTAATAKGAET